MEKLERKTSGLLITKETDFRGDEVFIQIGITNDAELEKMRANITEANDSIKKGPLINKIIASNVSKFSLCTEEDDEQGYIYILDLDSNTLTVKYDVNEDYEVLYEGKLENFINI